MSRCRSRTRRLRRRSLDAVRARRSPSHPVIGQSTPSGTRVTTCAGWRTRCHDPARSEAVRECQPSKDQPRETSSSEGGSTLGRRVHQASPVHHSLRLDPYPLESASASSAIHRPVGSAEGPPAVPGWSSSVAKAAWTTISRQDLRRCLHPGGGIGPENTLKETSPTRPAYAIARSRSSRGQASSTPARPHTRTSDTGPVAGIA
jgi:hypothetical protein